MTDIEAVRECLATLSKSPGSDELHSRVLKELADVLSEPLSVTSENTWRMGGGGGYQQPRYEAKVVSFFTKEDSEFKGK